MKIFRLIKLADIFTLINASCGFLSIYFSIQKQYHVAVLLVFLGIIFDLLDGKVARITGMNGKLGSDLDSLADIITTGVAVAVFCVSYFNHITTILASLIYIQAGILRLARYNVTKNITKSKKIYFGMTISMNGIFVPLLYFLHKYLLLHISLSYFLFPIYLIVSSVLMVSSFRFKKII